MCEVEGKAAALEWLSRAFWNVPDKGTVGAFDASLFALFGDSSAYAAECVAGAVEDILANRVEGSDDALRDARIDFTALFCGCNPEAPYPYESVYRSDQRLLMQPVRDEVVDLYGRGGFQPVQDGGNEPEDHISFELAFAAYLLAVDEEGAAFR